VYRSAYSIRSLPSWAADLSCSAISCAPNTGTTTELRALLGKSL
jgi:hypothetical protein